MNHPVRTGLSTARRLAARTAPALLATLLLGSLSACGDSDSDSSSTPSPSATGSATESAAASPGETSSSPPSQRDRDASVSAETARVQASASAALNDASAQGNAMADVSQSGVPTGRTDGKRAALVRVTNSTDEAAFYSVRVDFADSGGEIVDSVVLGFDNVEAGERVERYAISEKAAGQKTVPRIVKAQRTEQ